ncbi:hypothetical protein M8J76_016524 [Diaphorina citri]|nr:hypothetical protein M8J76_016524 [Diaphorina citri]
MSGDRPSSSDMGSNVGQVIQSAGYKLGKSIGTGSYSSVRLAYNLKANNQLDKASSKFINKFLPRELDILKRIKHPHIVHVLNMFGLGSRVFVFMNYCSFGDLLDHIRDNGHYSEDKGKVLFKQLLSAVTYLHSWNIAHRDLKCENILLSKPDFLMLTDFGFSRYFHPGVTPPSNTFCGSAAYAAPEIIEGTPYNPLLGDIWSMGCILFIMLTGIMPFDDSKVMEMVQIQKARSLTFPKARKVSSRAKVLVMKMLEPEPKLRASLVQIEAAAWLVSPGETSGRLRQGVSKVFPQLLSVKNLRELRKSKGAYLSLQATCPLGFTDEVRYRTELAICDEAGPRPDCFAAPLAVVRAFLRHQLELFVSAQHFDRFLSDIIGCARKVSPCSSVSSVSTESASLMASASCTGNSRPAGAGHVRGLSFGRIDELGRFETDVCPEPNKKESTISKVMKRLTTKETKEEEEMAWREEINGLKVSCKMSI